MEDTAKTRAERPAQAVIKKVSGVEGGAYAQITYLEGWGTNHAI